MKASSIGAVFPEQDSRMSFCVKMDHDGVLWAGYNNLSRKESDLNFVFHFSRFIEQSGSVNFNNRSLIINHQYLTWT